MNYWKHSLLSAKKFGGCAEDYMEVHKFMDSSKLFYFHIKHRVLLHNTYGIELCIQKFGETIRNADNKIILIRDIAAEHCKEDLFGVVPTLSNWFKYVDDTLGDLIMPLSIDDSKLKEFVLKPYLMSGNKTSLIITQSNFGVHLAKELLGIDYALKLAAHITLPPVNELLQFIKLKDKWQYTADIKQLKTINDEPLN